MKKMREISAFDYCVSAFIAKCEVIVRYLVTELDVPYDYDLHSIVSCARGLNVEILDDSDDYYLRAQICPVGWPERHYVLCRFGKLDTFAWQPITGKIVLGYSFSESFNIHYVPGTKMEFSVKSTGTPGANKLAEAIRRMEA